MENPKVLIFCAVLTVLVCCDVQTGYVDVNQQLGGLDSVNGEWNSLCYTEKFLREFQSVPAIATCLSEFDTKDQTNYHLEVRIRRGELSETGAKFMIYARSDVSVWNRVVFAYLATDRSDAVASTTHLQTEDLSGCGNVLQQDFPIQLGRNTNKLHLVAFLNGMDVSLVQNKNQLSYFEISIEITEKLSSGFIVQVSRASLTQIYSVSIGFVGIQKAGDELDIIEKTEKIQYIQPQIPYVKEIHHSLDIKNCQSFVGFEKFSFSNDVADTITSLAISFQEDNLLIGSLDSSNLQFVQISYLVIKEKIHCELDEIIVYIESKGAYECRSCNYHENRVPNYELDACVCLDDHYEVKGKCYQVPKGGHWDEHESSFVCQNDFTMIFDSKKDRYLCQLAPKYKMWEQATEKWVCIDEYYDIGGDCLALPENSQYDRSQKKFICLTGYIDIEGVCTKSYENEEWSTSLRKFVCKDKFYRVGSSCLQPFAHSIYDQVIKQFRCIDGFYMRQPGLCDELPLHMYYDEELKHLICEQGYYDIEDVKGCAVKPPNMDYDSGLKQFFCKNDYYPFEGDCKRAGQNQEYSLKIKAFICKSDTYRVRGNCRFPIPNSYYSQIKQDFQCNEGFYEIGKKCLSPPENMKYHLATRRFICVAGFEDIDDECIRIPKLKQWNRIKKRFICLSGYVQLEDSSCGKVGTNEYYDGKIKKILCNNNYHRINKRCQSLPDHALWDQISENFFCRDRYFRDGQGCSQCHASCATCQNDYECKSCKEGFEPVDGLCNEECGDGTRFQAECDDGNSKSGDGCSDECTVEEGWICQGGSPSSPDSCKEIQLPQETFSDVMEIRMVGMSHLFGKIVLNVKLNYVPRALIENQAHLEKIFRILTNSQIPLKVSSVYIDTSRYTFVVLYDFNRFQPIPEYLTRVQISPEIKKRYYENITIKPLFVKINPAFMALKGNQEDKL